VHERLSKSSQQHPTQAANKLEPLVRETATGSQTAVAKDAGCKRGSPRAVIASSAP